MNKEYLMKNYNDLIINFELDDYTTDWFSDEFDDESGSGGYWDCAMDLAETILSIEFNRIQGGSSTILKDNEYNDFFQEHFNDLTETIYDIIKYEL